MKHSILLCALLVGPLASFAAENVTAPLRDPWVPPSVREHAQPMPETRGEPLRAQVERKLRHAFDAADTQHAGSITLEQARAAQLGYVVQNFGEIDTARSGRVTFDDVKRFLRSRGARSL
jgi:hypothetical protein